MKAMKAKEVPLHKLKFPMLAQLKYDGVRLITKVVDDMPTFYTYNGKVVPLPKLCLRILNARLGNVMLDGELVHSSGKMTTRTKVSGMVNSAMHGGQILESNLSYTVFDSMTLEEFENQKCAIPYSARYGFASVCALKADLQIARTVKVKSIEEVQELTAQMYNDGFEGLILKPFNHLYEFKRSANWVKIKETKTADLICTDVTPGTGKYDCMIGALVCEGKVEGKDVIVKAGSGLNDADRALPAAHYIGKTVELKYNSVTQDQRTGQWSLFLPRFVAVRFDK